MLLFLIVMALVIVAVYHFIGREPALWVAVLTGIALVLMLVGVVDLHAD